LHTHEHMATLLDLFILNRHLFSHKTRPRAKETYSYTKETCSYTKESCSYTKETCSCTKKICPHIKKTCTHSQTHGDVAGLVHTQQRPVLTQDVSIYKRDLVPKECGQKRPCHEHTAASLTCTQQRPVFSKETLSYTKETFSYTTETYLQTNQDC